MRIIYIASAIEVDGESGGATHVQEVTTGLERLGHRVRVVARARDGEGAAKATGLYLRVSRRHPMLGLLSYPLVKAEVRRFRPDAVMERFYNFAGAGILAARRVGIPALLEVNAPMVDPRGSLKSRVDRVLLGAMRRWAVRQAKWSRAIVTPLATTVPPEVSRRKIRELPWGANVERFTPATEDEKRVARQRLSEEFGLSVEGPLAVFLGSFRAWHGVGHFAEAARLLLEKSEREIAFMAIGGGPELEPLREKVQRWGVPADRFVLTGAQAHERIPDMLRGADMGVAPFDLEAHAPLREFGFYWSPLKVFEYMACGLAVVTIDVEPLNTIVRPGVEGLLYASGDVDALAERIATLARDGGARMRMGESGRQRVVANYSWEAHCKALDRILKRITTKS
jgi:glycosyltransferase involved in cell wall biosynthesis